MLDHRGIERWDVDSMEPGAHVGEQLRTAINACDLCVFLATTTSLRAEWCYAELGAFWGQGKKSPHLSHRRKPAGQTSSSVSGILVDKRCRTVN